MPSILAVIGIHAWLQNTNAKKPYSIRCCKNLLIWYVMFRLRDKINGLSEKVNRPPHKIISSGHISS